MRLPKAYLKFLPLCLSLLPLQSYAAVTISEVMASNNVTITDEDGDDSDWIELHNNGASAVNINGWYLTDDDSNLTKWQLPNISLPAGGYQLVFASNKDRAPTTGELHSNFKLSAGGEYVGLIRANGTSVEDEIAPTYPQQFTDISYGGGLYFPNPTPGAANSAGVSGLVEPVAFSVDHGFYNTQQNVALTTPTANTTIRYTLDGSEPSRATGCTPPANGDAWSWEYYEGTWTSLPNFSALTPVATGTADDISINPRLRDSNYGLRFTGCVEAEVPGLYTFEASSDDGSQVFVDGNLVVDNDGVHGTVSVSATIFLDAGLHSITTTMFQGGGGQSLSASWISPARSNGYLTTEDNNQFYAADANSTNVIELPFSQPTSGNFQFQARVQGPSGSSDSFWVQLNNGPLWLFSTGNAGSFGNQLISDNGSVITAPLAAGDHVLRVFPREDGTRLASVTVIGSNCDGSCENILLEAEAGNYRGNFVAAGITAEPIDAERWFTYTNPLPINSTTTLRATAVRSGYLPSRPATATYLFLDDVVLQSRSEEPPAGWPAGPVNSQDLDYGMDPDIVDPNPAAVKASLASLPSIVISTDIDNLLHPGIGIYTNAYSKGRYWERPASIELIDGTGAQPGFTQDAGIRVRGGFSRSPNNPKHSFRAFFRSDYDGNLEYPLFESEGVDTFEKVDFRSSNNYSWAFSGNARNTLLREVWGRDTQRDMGLPHTRSRYYHLYINGVYWGVFMTQERVSKEFAASYFGGEEQDYDVVKHNRSNGYRYEATDGTNASWNQLFDYIADQNVTAAEYAAIDQVVDLDNLADYIMINAYEGDTDGSPSSFLSGFKRGNNWYAIQDAVNATTKWRFFQHDGEHASGARRNASLENNLLGPYAPFNGQTNEFFLKEYFHPYWLHAALTSNAEYRQRFIDRAGRNFRNDGALTDAAALARWNARKAQVTNAILAQSARWGDSKRATPRGIADWQAEVNYVETNHFPGRSATVYAQMVALGLASNLPTPQASIPSGSLIAPGTAVVISATAGTQIYYTLNGTDPRTAGGGIAAGALSLIAGESIIINSDATLVLRSRTGTNWGPVSTASYSTNTIPVIDAQDDQFTAVGDTVALQLTATDDDPLTWSQVGLPNGLSINANTGLISGSPTSLGSSSAVITVDDGDVTVDLDLNWKIVPPAPIILNEYNAVSGSKFLGGGDNTTTTPADTTLGRIQGNGGDWFELVVTEDHLDLRGWQLAISDDGVAQPLLTFSNNALWSDLRAGTIITIAENELTAANATVYAEDASYSPATGDWWINVVANDLGSATYITASDIKVSNDNWQLTILDNLGNTQFGAAGEGIGGVGGVGSEEVGKLEQDPNSFITAGSDYDDGTSSSFGAPNIYAGGTLVQDFSLLRPTISTTPTISIADTSTTEGGFLRFVLTLSEPATQDVAFDLSTTSNDATSGTDFLEKNGLRTILAGATEKTIWVETLDDTDVETTETVTLTLSNINGALPGTISGQGLVEDNDASGNLPVLSISNPTTVEGGFARFVISLSAPTTQPVSFVLNSQGQTATLSSDFTPKSGGRSIAAGATEITIWVTTIDDSAPEGIETFTLALESVSGATISNNVGQATILDNDGGTSLPTLSIANAVATEGDFVRFQISLSAPSLVPVSFTVATSDVSATSPDDYQSKNGGRTIAAGDTDFTLWVPTVDDVDSEGVETFTVTLSNQSNAEMGNAVATGTINDNEGQVSPSLTVTDATALEGAAARLTVNLSQAATSDTIITIATVDESATGGNVDYQTKGGTRIIPAGNTELVLWIPLPDDALVEGPETFRLEILDGGSATVVDGTGVITIQDND